jgi:acetyltransferase-like isoleucine patch superfamily enzyme
MITFIGKHTYGALKYNTDIPIILSEAYSSKKVSVNIGSFTSIGDNVTIFEIQGYGHFYNEGTNYPFGLRLQNIFNNFCVRARYDINLRNVNIGSDVWIGSGVSIAPGSNIGDGSVIATNSHVVGNVEPYAIYGGNPARIIKYRFSEYCISKFLELKWWDLEDEEINSILPYLQMPPSSTIFEKIYKTLEKRGIDCYA